MDERKLPSAHPAIQPALAHSVPTAGAAAASAGQITIRRATLADAEIITEFNAAIALETENKRLDLAVLGSGVRRLLADEKLGFYHVAEWRRDDGCGEDARGATASNARSPAPAPEIVGQMLVTYEFSDWRDGLFWWIQSVYVRPDARRLGIYRMLHGHVEALARASGGACGLRLYVDKRNTRAQQVYRALGMVATEYDLYETDWSK